MLRNANNRNTVIIILAVVIIAILGIVFGIIIPRASLSVSRSSSFLDIPTISSAVVSAETGESHNVTVDFKLEIDESSSTISLENFELKLTDIISKLDYDQISGSDSVEYIKSEVQGQLSESVPGGQIKNIYITRLESGGINISIPASSPSSPPESQRSKVIKSLFPNIK